MIRPIHIKKILLGIAIGALSCQENISSPTLTALSEYFPLGGTVTVSGTLVGVTFNNEEQNGGYLEREERYYLLKDINVEDSPYRIENIPIGDVWGLGIELLPNSFDDDTLRPQNGVRIRARGTFQSKVRSTFQFKVRKMRIFPIIEDVSQFEVLSSPKDLSPLKRMGESCSSDMECDDNLICDRVSSLCGKTPLAVEWGSLWHDLNGACVTDDDCPLSQVCYLEYTIGSTSTVSDFNLEEEDRGKHICVLANDAKLETVCPRIGTLEDFLGGRYVAGKEVCIRGKVSQLIGANDGDTHLQLKVNNPIIFPDTSPSLDDFGASTEISPPNKDPVLGSLAVVPPDIGTNVIVLGTYRFDNKHGWFEIHPVKAWWPDS